MFNTWVKKLSGVLPAIPSSQESTRQGANAFDRKNKRSELIDLTETSSFAEEARKQSMAFMNKLRSSSTSMRPTQVPTWAQTRNKVKRGIADVYDFDDLVDEITEKLEDAAEHDTVFKKLVKKL